MRKTKTFAKVSLLPCGSRFIILATVSLVFGSVAATAANPCYQGQPELARLQPEIEKEKLRLNAAEIEERRDAVMRLGAFHREAASRAAIPALTDSASIVRIAAATAVKSLPMEESTPLLIPLLNDQDPFVRQEVAYALGSVQNRRAVAALIERLSIDNDDGVRGAAAVALGMIRDDAAVVALARVLSPAGAFPPGARKRKTKENSFVLRATARSLGEINSRAGVPALIDALSNDSLAYDIRREAAKSLGVIADPTAVPALRLATLGHDPHLSLVAVEALHLIELASPRSAP